MTDTPNLELPYILASQAQKHVTHNEAIRALDCLVQLSVANRTLTSPPASPGAGDRYIVGAGATGDWAGQSDKVAAFQDGAWAFYTPKDGWLAWVVSDNVIVVYEAAAWSPVPGGGGGVTDHGMLTGLADDDHLQYLTDARGDARYTPIDPETLGINAVADTTNRLALASPASLFNHEGAGHQLKVNKNSAADTASLLFQDGFSGRAEIGLSGDDDLHVKVSPDGATWFEGIRIDRSTGAVSFPHTGSSSPSYRNRTINPGGAIAQSGVGSTTDGNYGGPDQWYVLTQSAAVTTSQLQDVANGVPAMMRMTQSNATAQRMGWAQPFESAFVKDLRGKTIALAAKVRMSAATTLRYAIVEWTGTADAITKDIVNSWTSGTFTAGNFFLASNLTIAATGSIALTANTLTDIALSASISSSMNNLVIFFWTDSTQAQTTTFDLGNVWFGLGASAPAIFEPPDPADDLYHCWRYLWTLVPAVANVMLTSGLCASTTTASFAFLFRTPMRATPTFNGGTASNWVVNVAGPSNISVSSFATSLGPECAQVLATVAGGFTAGQASMLRASNSSAFLLFDARL